MSVPVTRISADDVFATPGSRPPGGFAPVAPVPGGFAPLSTVRQRVACPHCAAHYLPALVKWACPVCRTPAPGLRPARPGSAAG